ncbi:hypothetical protein FRC06_009319, partial [Ceratobasidium sp. 370]
MGNRWSTYLYSSCVFDPSPIDLPNTPDEFGSGGFNMTSQAWNYFPEPPSEGTNGAWYSAEGVDVAWHDLATQTHVEVPNEQERVEPRPEPGPGAAGGDTQELLSAEQPYTRVVSQDRIIYRHPTAGQSYGRAQTRWEAERDKNNEIRGGNPYAMWASKDEWEAVKWMATTKVSQSSINELLKTKCFREARYSFKNAKSLFNKIEKQMGGFGGPKWNAEDVYLSDAPHDKTTLFYRKLDKCTDFLFGRPQFARKMSFGPEKHYDSDETSRLYDNPHTADDWNERQKTLPPGTTLGGILLASDATQLSTHSGDVAAHAVYASLANLDQSARASTSESAWILVAYIPKSKFMDAMSKLGHRPKAAQSKILGALNRRLFHRCMEVITRPLRKPKPHDVVDPEGNIR